MATDSALSLDDASQAGFSQQTEASTLGSAHN